MPRSKNDVRIFVCSVNPLSLPSMCFHFNLGERCCVLSVCAIARQQRFINASESLIGIRKTISLHSLVACFLICDCGCVCWLCSKIFYRVQMAANARNLTLHRLYIPAKGANAYKNRFILSLASVSFSVYMYFQTVTMQHRNIFIVSNTKHFDRLSMRAKIFWIFARNCLIWINEPSDKSHLQTFNFRNRESHNSNGV